MRPSRSISALLAILVLGFFHVPIPGHAAVDPPAGSGPVPLDHLLRPDGSLDLDSGYSGTVDPTGWTMTAGPDGTPRFVSGSEFGDGPFSAATGASSATSLWDDRFPFPGTNGSVNSVAVLNGELYVGGDFTEVGGIPVRGLARWSGRGWFDVGGGLNTRGTIVPLVNALAVSGDRLIVGGFFTSAGLVDALNIASWDGSDWSPLGGGLGDVVLTILPYEDKLYVGGRFKAASATAAWRVAVWDGQDWSALGSGLGTVNADALVYAIAVTGDTVYVGGDFLVAGGEPARSVARWDGAAWSALGEGVLGGVRALALFQGDLYAGGYIQSAGEVDVLHIARWDGQDWGSVQNGTDGVVRDFLVSGDTLLVAGEFITAGGIEALHVATWDGSEWGTVGGGLDGPVRSLFEDDARDLYVGGDFGASADAAAHRVSRWDGSGWRALGHGVEGTIFAVAVGHGGVYVGGDFTVAGGVLASGIAFWNGESWDALAEGTDGPVFAIALDETSVYVGGSFNTAGELSLNNVARWDGGGWAALGDGLNGPCSAVAVTEDGLLYAGGSFNQAGGVSTGRVAAWDGQTWSSLGTGIPNPFTVNALVADGPDLWVGGRFDGVGGTSAQNIARWDGSSWFTLGGGVNDEVLDLAVSGTKLYAVGRFTSVDGQQSTGFGMWDGSSWSVEMGAGLDHRPLLSVATAGDTVYVGGTFNFIGDVEAHGIARWSEGEWDSLETGIDGEVRAIVPAASDLWVGGTFSAAGGIASHNFARWDIDGAVPVDLLSFSALRRDAAVVLNWVVAGASSDHAGFHVHRAEPGAARVRISDRLLTGSARYEFVDEAPLLGPAEYWLAERTRAGAVHWYGPATVAPTGIASRLRLAQNLPNPFRSETRIAFTTGEPGPVRLRVFDLQGRQVRILADGHYPAGAHEAAWDRRDDRGSRVAAGIFFYRLDSPQGAVNRKLVILP